MNKEIENISNPKKELLFIIVATILGFICSQIIVGSYLAVYYYFSGLGLENLSQITSNPSMRIHFLVLQSITSFIVFFLAPYLYVKHYDHTLAHILSFKQIKGYQIFLIIFLMLFFIFFNVIVIEWNKNIILPDALNFFEKFAKARELELEKLTYFLISFENFGQYIIGIFAVAIIPGFCEEYLFRGLVQTKLNSITNNIHVAIWLSAFFFSFFHLQFYGLVPRMLLGVLFGYIYFFSGNLFYAMLAHFINNFISLTIFYLAHTGVIGFSVEEINNFETSLLLSFVSLIVVFFLLKLLISHLVYAKK